MKKVQSAIKSGFDSKCNTLTRGGCKKAGFKSIYQNRAELVYIAQSQYFTKPVDCAIEVLSSNFIKISSAFMVVLVALLF